MERMTREVSECYNCGYETETEEYTSDYGEAIRHNFPEVIRLCDVCANTHLGNATRYPRVCPDVKLYTSIAYIANMILDAIRKDKHD